MITLKLGRSRWVIYDDKYGLNYDASQIDPEWHPWIHYMTDELPSVAKAPRRKWVIDPIENNTGTSKQYVPYSTTNPKIEEWKPTQK